MWKYLHSCMHSMCEFLPKIKFGDFFFKATSQSYKYVKSFQNHLNVRKYLLSRIPLKQYSLNALKRNKETSYELNYQPFYLFWCCESYTLLGITRIQISACGNILSFPTSGYACTYVFWVLCIDNIYSCWTIMAFLDQYQYNFSSRRWGSSLPGLRTRDPPLSPPT